jgi:hypothetical protein
MFKILICLIFPATVVCAQQIPSAYVNPFIGTGGHGHTFPGAVTPFGMVQLSPDTRIDGSWDGCSGYHYSDSFIYGFSHTHLSGTGCSDYGDIMLMPVLNRSGFEPDQYRAGFSHKNESASPGYYAVTFNNKIKTELTATTRVGWHRYHFPSGEGHVILDLTHRDALTEGNIKIINNTTIAVKRISKAWAENQHAYAFIVFSKPFTNDFNDKKDKVIFHFKLNPGEPLLAKVGFSFVNETGAQKNLQSESPLWNFDEIRQKAVSKWNKELGKIVVTDPDPEKMKVFYTALYHTMIHPGIAMDVDGSYRGMDDQIHKAIGFTYYSVFSLWDTFRALHPLFTIIQPDRDLDFIKTFLRMYQEGGSLPVWELASNETNCMIGYHAVPVIVDAYVKGIRGFDTQLAFEAIKKSANDPKRHIDKYAANWFLSVEDEQESVSKTLEYSYDDWCIAQMAKYLGKKDEHVAYMKRSFGWMNLFDPSTGFMRPRKNGGWLTPFEPREVNNHFTEGNSWQYSFFVPQDIPGLIKVYGNDSLLAVKLDSLFTAPTQTTGREQADITGLIGQYAHGNEPSHHIAYLYNYVGKQEKTKKLVHRILSEFYSAKPDGLIGNEDCGQMSAWYVMSAMGIYSVTPGSEKYTLTEPYLRSFRVQLKNGRFFTGETIRNARLKGNFISHAALTGIKDTLERPQDLTDGDPYVPALIFEAPSRSFVDSMTVNVYSPFHDQVYFYTRNEKGSPSGTLEGSTITIKEKTSFYGQSTRYVPGRLVGSQITHAEFFKNPHPKWKIELLSSYTPQYHAGGPGGLIDGIRGDSNWRKGEWQGYQGQDFEAIVEFDETRPITEFSGTYLQDTGPWILFPKKVEYYTSTDGKNYELAAVATHDIPAEDMKAQVRDFSARLPVAREARFVKVRAYNYGKLPSWHPGAGYDAFIFVDELDFK